MSAAYLAIDWGTTNRRIYLMDSSGAVLETARDDRGVRAVCAGGFADELAGVRRRFGDLPALAAGMVGSTIGWMNVPYAPAPAGLAKLAAGVRPVEGQRLSIVPGVAMDEAQACDVMRGEEVQALGAIAAGLAPPQALLCQPGTHNKWIWTQGGDIVRFSTAMTGEMFALLRQHSILRDVLGAEVVAGPAFREGVARSMAGQDLLSSLFTVRASVLLGRRAAADAAAYCSGLLIGADVASRNVSQLGLVHLLADGDLGEAFTMAIEACGGKVVRIDSQAAFAAGIHQIWERIS